MAIIHLLQGPLDTIEVYQMAEDTWSLLAGTVLPASSVTFGTTLNPLNSKVAWVAIQGTTTTTSNVFNVFNMQMETWDPSVPAVPNIDPEPQSK